MSFFNESSDVLRRAISHNIFDPRPEAIQVLADCKSNYLGVLMDAVSQQRKQIPETSPWLHQQSSYQLPTTRRYVQSKFPADVPILNSDPTQNWMVELARFPVTYGSIGIIKSLEQYVARSQTVYSTYQFWGDPFAATNSVPISWYLRLSPISQLGLPWVNSLGAAVVANYLPGIPYEDLPRSDDVWFPASSCSAANIHLVIPGGYFLRVICIVDGSQQPATALACKLAGSVQLETNNDAQFVVRTTW